VTLFILLFATFIKKDDSKCFVILHCNSYSLDTFINNEFSPIYIATMNNY